MGKFSKFKLDNRGSGIVTVLICILFLTVLGTMVLMAAYTGYEMKISEAKGRQNAYNAEVALGEIRTGFQDVCSDAVGGALTDYLVTTGNYTEFVDSYVSVVKSWTVKDFEGNDITYTGADNNELDLKLFKTVTASGGQYNPEALSAMIRNCREGTIYINTYGLEATETASAFNDRVIIRQGPQYGNPSVVVSTDAENPENDRIVFKNLSVSFRTDGGTAENTITTDMEIKIPTDNLPSGESGMRVDQIQKYSLISAGSLKQTMVNSLIPSTVGGNSYFDAIETAADNIIVFGGDYSKTIVKNNVVVSGNAPEEGRSRVEFAPRSHLYASNIFVDGGSLGAFKESSLNVANDLILNGKSDVYIEGHYVGFGPDDSESNLADLSSAILYNGSDCTTYFTGSSTLTLGGLSFISNPVEDIRDFLTGNSIMIKSAQIAYLVDDVECIIPESYEDSDSGETKLSKTVRHNPVAVSSLEGYENYSLDTNKVILKYKGDDGEEVSKTYGDYNASVVKLIQPRGNQYMIYFFLKFNPTLNDDNAVTVSDEQYAVRYYSDYFRSNKNSVDEIIKRYGAIYRNLGLERYIGNGLKEENGKTTIKSVDNFDHFEEGKKALREDMKTVREEYYNFVRYLSKSRPSNYLNPQNNTKAYSDYTYDELYPDSYTTYSMHDYCVTYELCEEDPEKGLILKDEYDNPFYYMVDLQNLRRIAQGTMKFYKYNGENIAVVCRGDFTYPQDFNDADRNIKLILCEGTITISDDGNTPEGKPVFSGTIIDSGDIILSDVVSITSSSSFLRAYNSKGTSDEDVFTQYFRVPLIESFNFGEAGLDEGDYSIVFQLVNYVNWKKD